VDFASSQPTGNSKHRDLSSKGVPWLRHERCHARNQNQDQPTDGRGCPQEDEKIPECG
jgi:hypothetical protein